MCFKLIYSNTIRKDSEKLFTPHVIESLCSREKVAGILGSALGNLKRLYSGMCNYRLLRN